MMPLKILHMISQRPDSTGSGFYLQAMLRQASRQGHENYLLAGLGRGNPAAIPQAIAQHQDFLQFENALPFPVPGMSDVMPYRSSRFADLSPEQLQQYEQAFEKKMRSAVQSFQPDIVHSHHLWLLTALGRNLFPGLPLVATCHGTDLRQFHKCPHLQEKIRQAIPALDGIFALSRIQKKEIMATLGVASEKIHCVGGGFDGQKFAAPSSKPPPKPVQLIYAGKLYNAKGVPWLLRALGKIKTQNWHLHLVGGGSGDEYQNCLQLARQLEPRVTIHGKLPQTAVAELMAQSHIFILPSFFEGLPLVLMEALASGCRIIATDLPGVQEILGPMPGDFIALLATPRLHSVDQPFTEDAIIFENSLRNAIEKGIRAVEKQPNIELGQIETRLRPYTWPAIFKKVEEVYMALTD